MSDPLHGIRTRPRPRLGARRRRGRRDARGFLTDLRRYPEDDGCLVVLCNRDDWPVRELADQLERVLLELASGTLEPGLVTALEGEYVDASGRTLIVEATAGVLRARIHWSGDPERGPTTRAVLRAGAEGELVFDDSSEPLSVELERDGEGPVRRIRIGENLSFERR